MAYDPHADHDSSASLRQHLINLLRKSKAHKTFAEAVSGLPAELRGVKPDKLPYSIWQLVDHIRIVQWDILEFCRNPSYQSPSWPAGYWTTDVAPPTEADWQQTLDKIREDLDEFIALLDAPGVDLYTPLAHGQGQTLLREALLIADHTAYHVGEIILIRRLLDAWPQ